MDLSQSVRGGHDSWLGSDVPISASTHLCFFAGRRSPRWHQSWWNIPERVLSLTAVCLTKRDEQGVREGGRVWKQPMEDITAISQTRNCSSRWPRSRQLHFLALQFPAQTELRLTFPSFTGFCRKFFSCSFMSCLRHFSFLQCVFYNTANLSLSFQENYSCCRMISAIYTALSTNFPCF